jgi:hypothetical protein
MQSPKEKKDKLNAKRLPPRAYDLPTTPHNVPNMTKSAPTTPQHAKVSQDTHKAVTGAKPPRISAKTRKAVDILVTTGRTQRDAALEVGMNEKALSRALKKPHVADFFEKQKMLAMQDVKHVRKMGEVAAMRVAIDLMHNSTSDSVKARMVEFFAGEARKGPQTVVNVQQNNGSTGYEMARPGQRVVDIIDNEPPNADQQTGSQQHDSDDSQ